MGKYIQNMLIRMLDVIGSVIGIFVSIIPIILISVLIKKEDGGTIFFKQKRIGQYGKIFWMFKIRSMVLEAESIRGQLLEYSDVKGMFKMKEDPRITKVGKYIRKNSLDELPQFINVLRGDMSLVGPRPALLEEYYMYNSHEKNRVLVKPGMTGLWQISGRSDLSFNQMIELDMKYIHNRSLLTNIKILTKTIIIIFKKNQGSY